MTERKKRRTIDWQEREERLGHAREWAEEILENEFPDLRPPVNPLELLSKERGLKVIGADFRNRFDGQLEYHPTKRRFLLFFNTKYDSAVFEGEHHPRTRFSVSHEAGHFFLEHHRQYLLRGGKSHGSRSEFRDNSSMVEAEADAFASGLLLPSKLARPLVNDGELSRAKVERIASTFQTSFLSTAIRSVQLSDFPCAVCGIRDGRVAWRFQSATCVEGKCYPPGTKELVSPTAVSAWKQFSELGTGDTSVDGRLGHWFRCYRDGLEDAFVREEYLAIPVMKTLVALVTADEDDLFPE